MEKRDAEKILERQKAYFETGATLPVSARKKALRMLGEAIDAYEEKLYGALRADLGKSKTESYMCETGLVKSEITYMLRHVAGFAREKRVRTPLAQYVSRSFEKPSPYGSVLIMSPWNYPFLLTMDPLVDAIAAGNTAVLKPSAYAPCTAQVIADMIRSCFPPEFVTVVKGGRAENTSLLELPFDYIFFTGGKKVGREVMRHAAEHLIPITLELGGKSPCIVDKSANIPLAAKRIVFGKFVNCGQTCVAPDYIYCDETVKPRLIKELKKQIRLQYGEKPLENENYGKMINEKHFHRVMGLINQEKVVIGGRAEEEKRRIEPTVLDNITWEDRVMGEEIFGPVLPVLTYASLEKAARKIQSMPCPLALYIFSSDKRNITYLKEHISFGGGCINDTLIHLATSRMGFGGVGESGMGSYHGKYGFETFTHRKSIVDKKTFPDLPMRYQPYSGWKDIMIRMFVK